MFRLLLHCTLILTLISCPLRCLAGLPLLNAMGIQLSDQAVNEGCPACCSKPKSQPLESSENSHSEGGCSCLCEGAILLVDFSVDQMAPQVDVNGVLNDTTGSTLLNCNQFSSQRIRPAKYCGRTVRTLLMSFLC